VGAEALADALNVNTSLTIIFLAINYIGDEGATALADALKVNTSLKTIYLNQNQIGDEGALVFADALKVNTSVTGIYLNTNEIGDEGALALADALQVNTSLRNINLESNHISNEGAAALAYALQVNTSLTCIALNANTVERSYRDDFEALVARNKRFRSLFLFDARQMLLSLMCADECGVVWPYLLGRGNTDGIVAPDTVETIRAEFLVVVAERRRRLQGVPQAKRRRLE
jgi:hypothetical protein